jgi:glycosyltransferase involved in cell wall biosynthesis
MKNLVFTVTNDLTYDQRMIRICRSLSDAGYQVLLVGRTMPGSKSLHSSAFAQKRLNCIFSKGKLFYAEFNLRLFFFLLFTKMDLVCAIDLDTILPCYLVSRLKKITRVYDAHELFCEMKEIVERPGIYKAWKWLERLTVPKFPFGYTVNQPIADQFRSMYGVEYHVIRNIAALEPLEIPVKTEKYILYQGAVNEGRSFETLIPAMLQVDARLIICGEGNFMPQVKAMVAKYGLQQKVIFKGKLEPTELRSYTTGAWIGITLFDKVGLSNYYSLANRFFDYLHAGIPQICVDYPVYHDLNNHLPFAVLINNLEPDIIAAAINRLLNDDLLYRSLQENALIVRQQLNWQNEEQKLISFYSELKLRFG